MSVLAPGQKKHKVFVSFYVFFCPGGNRHAWLIIPSIPCLLLKLPKLQPVFPIFHPTTRIVFWRLKDHEYFSVLSHSLGQESETAEMF